MKVSSTNSNKRITWFIISSVLTTMLVCIAFYIAGILGNGNDTILRGDLYVQYVSFIKDFTRNLQIGKGFTYSFSQYLGSGTMLSNAYYCINPFNLIMLIPKVDASLAIFIIILLKISISSGCFNIFARKWLVKEDNTENNIIALIFSVFYSISGYVIILHFNLMWLDAIYVLPILIYFILNYIHSGKCVGMIISYAYLFVTNFYMGYMVGIFSFVLFMLIGFIYPEVRNRFKNVKRFYGGYILSVIIAVMMCAVVLFPAALYMVKNQSFDNKSFTSLSVALLDIINSMFIGHMPSIDNKVPFLYCGIPALLCIPLYFVGKRIDNREKKIAAILIIFLIVCCIFLPLFKAMHAFDCPDYYGFRFSFLLIFCFASMGCRTLCISKETEASSGNVNVLLGVIWGFVLIGIYIGMIYFQTSKYSGCYLNDYEKLTVNIVFIVLWVIGILIIKSNRYLSSSKKLTRILLPALLLAVCVVEVSINNDYCLKQLGKSVSEEEYRNWTNAMEEALSQIDDSAEDFYRIRVDCDTNFNSASFY